MQELLIQGCFRVIPSSALCQHFMKMSLKCTCSVNFFCWGYCCCQGGRCSRQHHRLSETAGLACGIPAVNLASRVLQGLTWRAQGLCMWHHTCGCHLKHVHVGALYQTHTTFIVCKFVCTGARLCSNVNHARPSAGGG